MDETLFLTVQLIDRFLERQTMSRKKLQLVGMTAMLLACKYEEVCVPIVEDLIVICDKAYTRTEVLEMVIIVPYFVLLLILLFHPINQLFSYQTSIPIGETHAEHLTIQYVCSNTICIHEEIPQGSSV